MNFCTIDGFENLTAQEVFDISSKHLLKQNAKSIVVNETSEGEKKGSMCMYRGPNGTQCAAGPFLKDEFAHKCEVGNPRGGSWRTLVEEDMVPLQNSNLIEVLQTVHDRSDYKPKDWPELLQEVAEIHNLVFNP